MTTVTRWDARPFTLTELAAEVDTFGTFTVYGSATTRTPRLRLRLRYTDEALARQLAQYLGLRCFVRPGAEDRGTIDTFVVEARGARAQRITDLLVDLLRDDTRARLSIVLDRLDDVREARRAGRSTSSSVL